MQNELLKLNREFTAQGYPYLEMGIGINTGAVIVGNIGSETRMKYGIVGRAVNTAARIESNTTGGQVLIGESTYNLVKDLLTSDSPKSVMMKGLKEPLVYYPVKAIGPPFDIQLEAAAEVQPQQPAETHGEPRDWHKGYESEHHRHSLQTGLHHRQKNRHNQSGAAHRGDPCRILSKHPQRRDD